MPRTLFRQNLLLMVVLILLGQLISGLVFVFAVQQPRAVKLARLAAQQVSAVQLAAAEMDAGQRARFLAAMAVGTEFQVFPAAALPLDRTRFVGFDEPDTIAVRIFVRQLRAVLGERAQIVRWQDSDHSIWIGLLLGDDPYWITFRGGQLEPVAPWLFIGISGVTSALALLGAFWISRRINRPLQRLVDAAGAMGRGEKPQWLDPVGPTEIATVAGSFNQLADDLASRDRERAIMLAGVSHDLRTPLSKLRLALDISEARLEPELFEQMGRSITDIDRLLDQFMDFARGGEAEAVEDVEADGLIQAVLNAYRQTGAQIEARLTGGRCVLLRPLAWRRLLVNLLDNALKYGAAPIRVASRIEDGCWIMTVSDAGPGIAATEVARVLQPFARGSEARGGQPGAGLGLTIVQRICEQHGGTLYLGSHADGAPGLVATVRLPLLT